MLTPRSEITEAKYQEFKKAKQNAGADLCVFNLDDETVVREFEHWLIIENRFPYDNMTNINHLLVPRRAVCTFKELSAAEQTERLSIYDLLVEEKYYDAMVENFPRSQSVSRHVHLHLVRWKYTTESGQNKSDVT